jgi:catechol 2,3-dioxygenase-like lactoylglutathione lyase family enzyme
MTQTVFPELRITDYARSKAFYVDGLGFQIDWEHRFEPNLPVFMQLTRAGQSLFLSEHGNSKVGGAAYFFVPDVDAWYRDFTGAGVRPESPPTDAPYGIREMCVVDPDGNRLRFGTTRV